ncbi:hypothetical protein NDU88_005547 [Pleurodeles waltl]|uniref:Uncharacterized protein n=1 Tax=Pleurodeles waltl TaxID=8319 RepID=A0AAV7WAR6_PLEWA|nr:hypothetical protein NDU88_005547 [Pleurodeles waltl]
MLLLVDVVAPAGHVAVQMGMQVAVLAAVSAAGMLPVLALVQVLVVVEGDTRPSPAASDGCPLGMMLLTVVVAAAVQVAAKGGGAGGRADGDAPGGACSGALRGTGCGAVSTDGGHQFLTWSLRGLKCLALGFLPLPHLGRCCWDLGTGSSSFGGGLAGWVVLLGRATC